MINRLIEKSIVRLIDFDPRLIHSVVYSMNLYLSIILSGYIELI